MSHLKSDLSKIDVSPELQQTWLYSKAIENLDKVVDLLAFSAIAYRSTAYYPGEPSKALAQAALSYLLLKSGTEIGITTAIGGIALREILH